RPVPSRTVTHGPVQPPAPAAGPAPHSATRVAARPGAGASRRGHHRPRPAPRWSAAPAHPAVAPELGEPYLMPTAAVAQPGIGAATNGYLLSALLMLGAGAALILLARGIRPGRPGPR